MSKKEPFNLLVVDISSRGVMGASPEDIRVPEMIDSVAFSNGDSALLKIKEGGFPFLFIFANQINRALTNALRAHNDIHGILPGHCVIFSNDHSPSFLAYLLEFGIDHVYSDIDWQNEISSLLSYLQRQMQQPNSFTSRFFGLGSEINAADHKQTNERKKAWAGKENQDYLSAYYFGMIAQNCGEFKEASESFANSVRMNPMFKPAAMQWAQTLMVIGDVKKSRELLEKLNRENSGSSERHFLLSSVYTEMGETDLAKKTFDAACHLNSECSDRYEAETLRLLAEQKWPEALSKMGHLDSVGPYLVARIIKTGVNLSKNGDGEVALSLYERIHPIVRQELKYKISLNAALCCYRMEKYSEAMNFALRCQEEYNLDYPKLEKIKRNISEGLKSAS